MIHYAVIPAKCGNDGITDKQKQPPAGSRRLFSELLYNLDKNKNFLVAPPCAPI